MKEFRPSVPSWILPLTAVPSDCRVQEEQYLLDWTFYLREYSWKFGKLKMHVQKATRRLESLIEALKDEYFAFKLNTLICILKPLTLRKVNFLSKYELLKLKCMWLNALTFLTMSIKRLATESYHTSHIDGRNNHWRYLVVENSVKQSILPYSRAFS